MFRHIFYTWFLAVLIHPFLFGTGTLLFGDDLRLFTDDIETFMLLSVGLTAVAFPFLFAGWILLSFIQSRAMLITDKFYIWLISVPVMVASGFYLLLLFFGLLDSMSLMMPLPAAMAAMISILIRLRQFVMLSIQTERKNKAGI